MKLKILGSAAAEAIPALWCECELCNNAMKKGGKELRRRTCYLLNEDTLIDFGPDAFWQSWQFKVDLRKIERILYTHSHVDHLNPVELFWRINGYSRVSKKIKVYGNRRVFNLITSALISEIFSHDLNELQIEPFEVVPQKSYQDDDLEFMTIAANHAVGTEQAVNYCLNSGNKRVLIANDTGMWSDAGFAALAGVKLDIAIIECTCGLKYATESRGHLGAQAAVEFCNRLRECGAVGSDTLVYVNHFSHNAESTHEQLEEFFAPYGIGVAYDGLVLDV